MEIIDIKKFQQQNICKLRNGQIYSARFGRDRLSTYIIIEIIILVRIIIISYYRKFKFELLQ